MNWNEKLDEALKIVSKYPLGVKPVEEVQKKCQCETAIEAINILETLVDDNFIRKTNPPTTFNFIIKGKGTQFLKEGGYVARAKKEKKKAKFEFWGFIIIILTFFISVYQAFF